MVYSSARLAGALKELAAVVERMPAAPLDAADEAALLPEFLKTRCYLAPGVMVKFSAFKIRFLMFADEHGRHRWTQRRLIRELPPPFVYGCHRGNQRFVANLSLDGPGDPNAEPIVVRFGRLVVPKRNRAGKKGILRADRVARHLKKNGFSASEIASHLAQKGVIGLDDQPLAAEAVDALLGDSDNEDVAATVRQLVSHLNSLTKKGN